MIFAAGLGTRLQPLTNEKPKALIKICNVTLLERAIDKLIKTGVDEIVINVHHHAEKIKKFVQTLEKPRVTFHISDEQEKLLDTGGGLVKASPWLKDASNFIVYNVDVLSDINLNTMMRYHRSKQALATLAVRNRETKRKLLFDDQMNLAGWLNHTTGEIKWTGRPITDYQELAFSGIQILHSRIFQLISENGKFPIIPSLLELAKDNTITAYPHNDSFWLDVGKKEQLAEAEHIICKQKFKL